MIDSIVLKNFKCFGEQVVDLAPLTLLSGLNGMGKSTVLQSLLLLRQSFMSGLLPSTGLALNGDLVSLGTAADVLYENADEDTIGITYRYSPPNSSSALTANWRYRYDRNADVLNPAYAEELLNPMIFDSNAGLFSNHFHYLQAERLGPRTTSDVSDYIVGRQRQLGTRGEYTVHYLMAYGDELIPNPALAHPTAPSLTLRAQVEAWLGEISPGTRLDLAQYRDVDVVRIHYAFVRGSTVTKPYRATNVGFGLSYGLPVLVALLAAPSGSLVLVENPEAHLHPRGQAELGRLSARAAAGGVQVLVETHSDHVLNGVRLAVRNGMIAPQGTRIHFFHRSSDSPAARITSPVIDKQGRIAPWPEGFFDEFDRALTALFTPTV